MNKQELSPQQKEEYRHAVDEFSHDLCNFLTNPNTMKIRDFMGDEDFKEYLLAPAFGFCVANPLPEPEGVE